MLLLQTTDKEHKMPGYFIHIISIVFVLMGSASNQSNQINSCYISPPKEAIYACKKLLKSNSPISNNTKFLIYASMSEAYLQQNQDDNALAVISKAIELKQNFADAYVIRSSIYLRKEKYLQALKDINKAIEINPEESSFYINQGLILRRQGRLREALKQYNKSIQLNPGIAMAYNNRGYVYRQMKEYKKAISDFRKAFKIDPNDTTILHSIGEITFELGDYDKATKIWIKVCRMSSRRIIYGMELDLHKQGFLPSKPDETCNNETIEAFRLCSKAKCIIGSE